MLYHVAMNLNRDLKEYVPGDTIDLDDEVAGPLLETGVVSTDRVVPVKVETPVEPALDEPVVDPQPIVGGEPAALSGEPSLDVPAPAVSVEATDITPPVEDDPSANL